MGDQSGDRRFLVLQTEDKPPAAINLDAVLWVEVKGAYQHEWKAKVYVKGAADPFKLHESAEIKQLIEALRNRRG